MAIEVVSIIALRRRRPEVERPYRAPVIGAIGTGAAFVSVVVPHPEARIIGSARLGAGLVGCLLYRRHLGIDPRELQQVNRPERPLDFLEVSYKPVLVPIFGTNVDGEAMHRAAAVVDRDATVEALFC